MGTEKAKLDTDVDAEELVEDKVVAGLLGHRHQVESLAKRQWMILIGLNVHWLGLAQAATEAKIRT